MLKFLEIADPTQDLHINFQMFGAFPLKILRFSNHATGSGLCKMAVLQSCLVKSACSACLLEVLQKQLNTSKE